MNTFLLFISGSEIFIVFLVILLLFGADKIPELARMFGKGVNEFRKAADDIKREFKTSADEVEQEVNEFSEKLRREKIQDKKITDDDKILKKKN